MKRGSKNTTAKIAPKGLKKRLLLALTARAVDMFDIISVRDEDSRRSLARLLPHRRIYLVPDPTLTLFGNAEGEGLLTERERPKSRTLPSAREREHSPKAKPKKKVFREIAQRQIALQQRTEAQGATVQQGSTTHRALEDEVFCEITRYFGLPENEKRALSELSRSTVARYYSARSMATRTLEIYRRLLGE